MERTPLDSHPTFRMRFISKIATLGLMGSTLFGASQAQAPAPAPQIDVQFLADALRAAAAFNNAVRNMNVRQTFNPSQNATSNQFATALGAGAGAGAAIGAMTGEPKGAVIGAAVGGAGALIVEAILKHQAAASAGTSPARPLQQATPTPERR